MSDIVNQAWTGRETWTARCPDGRTMEVSVYPFDGAWYAGTGPEGRILGATPRDAAWEFLRRYRMPVEELLAPGTESRAQLLARLAAVEAERDAGRVALAERETSVRLAHAAYVAAANERDDLLARSEELTAAVAAARADFAPREEPPSRAEVRALATLWGNEGAIWTIRSDESRTDAERRVTLAWLWEHEAHGGWPAASWDPASRCMLVGTTVVVSYCTAVSWQPQGHDGPVAWSLLRAMVEEAARG